MPLAFIGGVELLMVLLVGLLLFGGKLPDIAKDLGRTFFKAKRSLDEIRRAQAGGRPVLAETCPQYLVLADTDLDRPDFGGAKFCCSPPLRDKAHQEALWKGLADGTLAVCSSDHSAFFFEPQHPIRLETGAN